MERDLELPSCEQDQLDIRSDKDVNIVDVTDEINVEAEPSSPIASDGVKEVDGLNAQQNVGSDKDVDIVDITGEVNVEEERVSSLTMSDRVKEVDLNAEQSVGSDKDVDIVDAADEVNVEEGCVTSPATGELVKEVDGLSAEVSVMSDKDVNVVDVPYEIIVENKKVVSDIDVDIVDVNDEINIDKEHVSSSTSDRVKEVDGLNADKSVESDKDVDIVDITGEVNVEEENVQTELDGTVIRLQDSCQQMELMKSRAHEIDNCHVPQQESERAIRVWQPTGDPWTCSFVANKYLSLRDPTGHARNVAAATQVPEHRTCMAVLRLGAIRKIRWASE
ncbi:hypothetical protein C1H46_007734 [Malus baccata]|uniref:Uncharacterized protein n=1 Tax=Malus baccata TaxID=106549 RepID=A0A540N6J8_MALBA|nr:hypothetical protein C1H46_007734 [Malus baccata]